MNLLLVHISFSIHITDSENCAYVTLVISLTPQCQGHKSTYWHGICRPVGRHALLVHRMKPWEQRQMLQSFRHDVPSTHGFSSAGEWEGLIRWHSLTYQCFTSIFIRLWWRLMVFLRCFHDNGEKTIIFYSSDDVLHWLHPTLVP